jgi:exonuclease subunit 2|uniref:STRUCTURAL MAINTENANCE OF CHROMOSOMES PROTEIN n=1 Tax=Myoviridae sp. ctCo31 TaxID=2825053 RepID=A0A8S5ULW9_9CAUD|nr:MAG TPA: STRUCTURAL MAINTENANCE OF CHROMOSOMES PROTEIN [Myoviridae sp. ctCo31]
MIVFKKLKVKNFLSFGNNDTEIDLENYKLNLVTGSNGAGKSSLLVEGLTYALFGQPFRDIKKGQLINFINDKNSVVELEFSISSDEYKIIRGQKPNILQLFKNDELIPESASVKDFQEYIQSEVLRMSLASFKQLVVLGTANFIPFMQLSSANRRKLVDDLLDVSIFTKMDQLNKGSIKEINQQMNENLIKLNSLKSELTAYTLLLKEKNNSVFSDKEQLEQKLIEKKIFAKELLSKINELKVKVEALTNLIKANDVVETIKKLDNVSSVLANRIAVNTQKIQETCEKDFCLSCQQKISEEQRSFIIKGIQLEIDNDTNKSNQIQDKLNSIMDELKIHKERQTELSDHNLKLVELNTKFSTAIQEVKQLTEELNKETIVDSSVQDKINELNTSILELELSQQNWFNEKYLRTVLSTLLVDSGIKATVIKKFVPVINKKINMYLKLLGADYMFLLDNEFNEQIRGAGREKSSYFSFSQGEKSRVDLAIMFTWRDIASIISGTNINLLVLDEVFDSAIDSSGVSGLKSVLDSLDSNVYIISHREQLSDDFNRHIEVIKKGRFSILEVTEND